MSNHSPEKLVKAIHRRTRRKYSAEEKIRIVLQGLRGEDSIAELCRREGLNQNVYYRWSKEFLEAGKQRLSGNTQREATSDEVVELRKENNQLKQVLADTVLKIVVLKKVYLARDRCGTKNESISIREGGSDPDGGGFCVIHSQDTGRVWYQPQQFLSLVSALSGRRAGCPSQPFTLPQAVLEQIARIGQGTVS